MKKAKRAAEKLSFLEHCPQHLLPMNALSLRESYNKSIAKDTRGVECYCPVVGCRRKGNKQGFSNRIGKPMQTHFGVHFRDPAKAFKDWCEGGFQVYVFIKCRTYDCCLYCHKA